MGRLNIHDDFLINEKEFERENLDFGKDSALISWHQDQTLLVISNPEANTIKKIQIQMPEPLSKCTCVIQMPNYWLFCYGNIDPFTGIACMISTKDLTYKILPSWKPCCCSGGTYYLESVYIFGGFKGPSMDLAMKFDIAKSEWKSLSALPKPSIKCSCAVFFRNILISGNDHNCLYVYDTDIDSYSVSEVKVNAYKNKYLFSGNQRAYIMQTSGDIYESDLKNPYFWKSIGRCELYGYYQMGKIAYDNSFYFGAICSSDDTFYFYFVFDLIKKKVTQKKYFR
ncbi:unnamed protein product [Blepharisma stoltei]|uniref:Uncharacterized protein n=1 Tax=Blepharisma stoltei TaxID=1481888 RepID=A0AAU9J712_9CILI|nr:unnamed protein product [Blepharisma stoltei]